MIIGIDGNEANIENKVGVHKMAYEILWELYKLEDTNKRGHRYIIYLKNPPLEDLPPQKSYWKYRILTGGRIWILTRLVPELLGSRKPEVFLTPSHYVPPIFGIPIICIITDLGYLKFSEQFRKFDYWQLKYWTAISIKISKYIIAISQSTKKDIVRHYPFASEKIKVVHLAGDHKNYNNNIPQKFVRRIQDKYRITKKYIIFMSTLKPSKNIERLIHAFSTLRKKYNYQLVIVGKKGWFYDAIFKKIKKLRLEKEIIFTDYLPDKERAALMKDAKVFVLPSYWEGFGIDVLNSFNMGIPVVISKVASLPEVGGKAAIYIDPTSTKDIAEGIEKVLKMSSKEYNQLVREGYGQVLKFSWKVTAAKTLEIIEKTQKYL